MGVRYMLARALRCKWATRLSNAVVLLLLLLTAAGNAVELRLNVSLAPLTSDEWLAEYSVSPAVKSLVFARGRGDYRIDSWTLDNDDFVIERFGNTDRIRRVDNSPFTGFSARLVPHTLKPLGDYTPFLEFSDGSVAVFTGQFVAGIPKSDNAADYLDGVNNDNAVGPIDPTITIAPGDFGRMIVNAEVVEEPIELELGEGEYVYLGQAQTIETPMLTAVTDEAAPAWLRDHLYSTLADTYEYFAYRLGPLPGGKPFLLTVFRPLDGGRISFAGGVLGSQLVVDLGLGAEVPDTPESRAMMARFFAHESAHLWHRGGGVPAAGPGSWVHEGSADAMAWLALSKLDVHTPDTVLRLFQEAANSCARYLDSGSLREAGRRNALEAYYSCGAVIALATHGLMRARGRDLFDFWRRLLNLGTGEENEFRVDYYYLQVGQLQPGFDALLQAFVEEAHEDTATAVVELLVAGGVTATARSGDVIISAMP